jgi:2-methylisocitrate lyase-like PEP mutase family enzyme
MRRIGDSIDAPLLANMVDGGRTPVLSKARLVELGYRMAIFPATGFLAAAAALRSAYEALRRDGSSDRLNVPLYPFTDFSKLMGFEDVWAFERTHPETPGE